MADRRFSAAQNSYEFNGNGDVLNVDLTYNRDGVRLVKRFEFSRDGYDVGVEYLINNGTSQEWNATFYGQIKRDSHSPLYRIYWCAALFGCRAS